jgi:hypothetical protein
LDREGGKKERKRQQQPEKEDKRPSQKKFTYLEIHRNPLTEHLVRI